MMTNTKRNAAPQLSPDLTHASRLLSQSTISAVIKEPFSVHGWRILERWASYTPSKLVQLERSQGPVGVAARLLEQQRQETLAIDEAGPDTHLSRMEILRAAGLSPDL